MRKNLLIVNAHEHGFAFAWVQDENTPAQCFIPAYVVAESNGTIAAGDTISATIAPNFADKSAGTPWQAVKLHFDDERPEPQQNKFANLPLIKETVAQFPPAPAPITQQAIEDARADLDNRVLDFVSDTAYATTSEIASACNVDQRTAGNSAQRWFNKDKMARADVYRKAGLARPSFVLYAANAQNFLEGDQ